MKVMQCWDDSFSSDIPLVELLRKYNAKATFNIPTGNAFVQEDGRRGHNHKGIFWVDSLPMDELKDLYKGFRVAGHSLTHPNLCAKDDECVRHELCDSRDFIREFFGEEKFGFAYPGGFYDERLKRMVKDAGYLYARTTRRIDGVLSLDDPMELPSHCNFQDEEFWQKYETVREADGIFYFWGHSFQMMDDPALWADFEEKLSRIQSDNQAEWIDIADLF